MSAMTHNLSSETHGRFLMPSRTKVEQFLLRLEEEFEGTIYKVSQNDWAALVVSVPKKDGTLRVCGDYKMTVNQCAGVDQYPLPNAEDLFATLSGVKSLVRLIYHMPLSKLSWMTIPRST